MEMAGFVLASFLFGAIGAMVKMRKGLKAEDSCRECKKGLEDNIYGKDRVTNTRVDYLASGMNEVKVQIGDLYKKAEETHTTVSKLASKLGVS